MHLEGKPPKPKELKPFDKWALAKLSDVIKDATESFDNYDYSHTKAGAEIFFWKDFCDNYLEIAKHRLYGSKDESARFTLYTLLFNVLKLFAPIIPHVTEELYQALFRKSEGAVSIHLAKWPEPEWQDEQARQTGELAVQIIAAVRQWKHEQGLPLNAELSELTLECDKEKEKTLKEFADDMKGVLKLKGIRFGKADNRIAEGIAFSVEK